MGNAAATLERATREVRGRLLGHCLACVWQEWGMLSLQLSGTETLELELAPGDRVELAIRERACVGYRPPPGWGLVPCPDDGRPTRGSQCSDCLERSKLLACLRCSGERCMSTARRSNCLEPANHGVYLASFAPGVVKVGVARRERLAERIGEQGARAALVLAHVDGKEARWAETQIARLGVPDRLSPDQHLDAWMVACDPEQLLSELSRLAGELRLRLPTLSWAGDIEALMLPDIQPFAYRPRFLHCQDGLVLRAAINHVVGKTLLLEQAGGELVAFDASSLAGCVLASPLGDEHSQEQLAIRL